MPEHHGDSGFDMPYELLSYEPPASAVNTVPQFYRESAALPPATLTVLDPDRLPGILERVLSDAEVASQLHADSQYDSTVQGNTAYGPRYGSRNPVRTGYWASTPVDGSPAAAVVSTAFSPWLFEIDPVRALRQNFCRLLCGQVLAGVDQRDICVCDNFYTPHLAPFAGDWLAAMVDALAALVRLFGTPVISGKDSSAGSTRTDEGLVSVPHGVFLTAMGKVPDVASLLPEAWQRPGRLLVQIGPRTPALAGTVIARAGGPEADRLGAGGLDVLDVDAYLVFLRALAEQRRLFHSGTLIGAGGIAATLATNALAGHLGIDLAPPPAGDWGHLFEEHRCGALVEVDEQDLDQLVNELEPRVIGRLTAASGLRAAGTDLITPAVEKAWTSSFADRLA